MNDQLKPSAQKVQTALQAHGLACEVIQMQATTRSAEDAAQAVGCLVGQIVKSLLFKGDRSNQPVLVVASGANRVNEQTLSRHVSEPVIGGVPPVAHRTKMKIFIDEDLMQYPQIWAAAGTPHAVFKLTPAELKMITGGKVIAIK
jgi:prolyl-tRNA editing enzyme YbaK/EbsC (Cys-tRNA(Pro) deacylase)